MCSLEPPAVPERKVGSSRSPRPSLTSSVASSQADSGDHKKTLQELNNKLVSYVEKVKAQPSLSPRLGVPYFPTEHRTPTTTTTSISKGPERFQPKPN